MDIALMQEDIAQIQGCLRRILRNSGAHSILFIDRTGQLIAHFAKIPFKDLIALAALTAANLGATAAIANMVGEEDFALLYHRGERESIHFAPLGEDFLLVTLFGNRTSLGRVRLLVQEAATEISDILEAKATTGARL